MPERGTKVEYMVLIRNYSITDGVSQTQWWRLEISWLASKEIRQIVTKSHIYQNSRLFTHGHGLPTSTRRELLERKKEPGLGRTGAGVIKIQDRALH